MKLAIIIRIKIAYASCERNMYEITKSDKIYKNERVH